MIYDYKCLSCAKTFQLEASMTSKIVRGRHLNSKCPHCQSKKVRKVIHKAEIIFKGSGFYVKDKQG